MKSRTNCPFWEHCMEETFFVERQSKKKKDHGPLKAIKHTTVTKGRKSWVVSGGSMSEEEMVRSTLMPVCTFCEGGCVMVWLLEILKKATLRNPGCRMFRSFKSCGCEKSGFEILDGQNSITSIQK